jgi:hypothetical protein
VELTACYSGGDQAQNVIDLLQFEGLNDVSDVGCGVLTILAVDLMRIND